VERHPTKEGLTETRQLLISDVNFGKVSSMSNTYEHTKVLNEKQKYFATFEETHVSQSDLQDGNVQGVLQNIIAELSKIQDLRFFSGDGINSGLIRTVAGTYNDVVAGTLPTTYPTVKADVKTQLDLARKNGNGVKQFIALGTFIGTLDTLIEGTATTILDKLKTDFAGKIEFIDNIVSDVLPTGINGYVIYDRTLGVLQIAEQPEVYATDVHFDKTKYAVRYSSLGVKFKVPHSVVLRKSA
jgi:molybdopterin converting factor small subunit